MFMFASDHIHKQLAEGRIRALVDEAERVRLLAQAPRPRNGGRSCLGSDVLRRRRAWHSLVHRAA